MTEQTPTTPAHTDTDGSRESWLRRAADEFRQWIFQVSGIEVPDVHVSIGFGGVRYERGVAAVCYKRAASKDGKNHIFISPEADDTADILVSLLHELIHAALDCEDGHRGRFAEYATRLGLTAPFTISEPDIATAAQLMTMAAELGEFPHGKLTVRAPKPVEVEPGVTVTVGGGGTKTTSSGGPDRNRWISFYCDEHASPVRMTGSKAARSALVCLELGDGGVPCMKPLHRK